MDCFHLNPGKMGLDDIRQLNFSSQQLALTPAVQEQIKQSRQTLEHCLTKQELIYGINTGVGFLANKIIPETQLADLQKNIVLSHAAGTGPLLQEGIVSLILLLKINSLSRGCSSVRLEIIDALLKLYNQQVYPCIPAKGSVGASGDLAPLAHMAAVLIGEGRTSFKGKIITATQGLQQAGITPLHLLAKEGVSLVNGTQVSTAIALAALFQTEHIFNASLLSSALTHVAIQAQLQPLDARLHQIRGQSGQIAVADTMRELLRDSDIGQSPRQQIQDPYSIRCLPQVMGACLDYMRFVAEKLAIEANAVTDNPILLQDSVLSGGNFHAQPVAFAADSLALCLAEIGSITERRIALLNDPQFTGLPAFLVENSGLNAGFMIPQVVAAALVSANKMLSHPASVDNIPTSANQEDHVSMATHAAWRLLEMADNCATVVAIELLAACQGVELKQVGKLPDKLSKALNTVRQVVNFYDKDRFFADDIEQIKLLVLQGKFSLIHAIDLE